MSDRIHLAPKSLRKRATAPKDAGTLSSLRAEDFAGFTGRVVLLKPLTLAQSEACDAAARRRITEDSNLLEFDSMRQMARLRAAIVGVSEPAVDPARWMEAPIRPVTEADLEGVSMEPGKDGFGTPKGLRLDELFSAKDLQVLRAWDSKHHRVAQDEIDDILGNAIPTAD
jgi:hypothetical protein